MDTLPFGLWREALWLSEWSRSCKHLSESLRGSIAVVSDEIAQFTVLVHAQMTLHGRQVPWARGSVSRFRRPVSSVE